MKNLLLIIALLLPLAQTEPVVGTDVCMERPVINLPLALRQQNWRGPRRQGSCAYATTVMLLNWQGRYATANRMRATCGDGAGPERLAAYCDANGIRYAETTSGDVGFLEWAIRTRRGCGVTVDGGEHFVTLVAMTKTEVCLLDNNAIEKFQWMPREEFLAEWRRSHGWAVAVLYSPTAPRVSQ